MSRMHVETTDGQTRFEPGAEIHVRLEWDLEREPDTLELRLVWNTAGKGTADLDVVETVRFDAPMSHGDRTASMRLPDSPYSFSGKLISLVWALELVALPGRESTRHEILIGPGAREVQLTPV
ncbi:MAG TPA: hypothetical protein VML55_10190 [Planctomycetaceae bacterium]|nr:hypothetical protein [Planctomycetaceae bacterium]